MTRLNGSALLVASAILVILSAPPASAQQIKTFGDHWIAFCDNLRNCSAYAVTAEKVPGYIRIDRAGAPDAELKVTIAIRHPLRPFRLAFEPPVPGVLPEGVITQRYDPDDYMRTEVAAPADAMIAALRTAKAITYEPEKGAASHESPPGKFLLSGALDALAWIDAQQKRTGTQTALVKRGKKPGSAVPRPPQPPALRIVRTTREAQPPDYPSAVTVKSDTACGREIERVRSVWLGDTHVAYWFYCNKETAGKYNTAFVLFAAPAGKLTDLREVRLQYPRAVAAIEKAPQVHNPDYDRGQNILEILDRPTPEGDCGTFSRWHWTGARFELAILKKMPVCGGLDPKEWPVLYSAKVK
jgi:hypothetical protein